MENYFNINFDGSLSFFDVDNKNRLFIFYMQRIEIFDIEKNVSVSLRDLDNDEIVDTSCVSSNGKFILHWDIWDRLIIFDINKNKNRIYYPEIEEISISRITRLQLEFINEDRYFIYNCDNYLELVSNESLEPIIKINNINTPNTPVFAYNSQNNYLFISFYFDIYERYSKDYEHLAGYNLLKIFDIDKLKIISENLFNDQYKDIIYHNKSSRLVCLKHSSYGETIISIDILIFDKDKKNIEKLKEIKVPNSTLFTQYIIKNPITEDIFLIYLSESKEINVHKIDINNFVSEPYFVFDSSNETRYNHITGILFTKDGKYLLIGSNEKIAVLSFKAKRSSP